ncbi:hypothetical protein HanPSC8_Chr04g0144581 [Helianthus annuus]|nr:hypothetical protein HanPSC8_Chr04g0144581 [Helianthus annuus]
MQVRPLYKAQIAKGPDFLCFHVLCIGFDSLKPKTKTQLRFGPHPQIRLHNPVGWGGGRAKSKTQNDCHDSSPWLEACSARFIRRFGIAIYWPTSSLNHSRLVSSVWSWNSGIVFERKRLCKCFCFIVI